MIKQWMSKSGDTHTYEPFTFWGFDMISLLSAGVTVKEINAISVPIHTVKKITEFLYFFLPNLSETGKPLCWQGIFWFPPEKEFFVFWGGKSIPLLAGVIFSSLLNVIFPYFPYFPIKLTGKLLEDSWLATGAPGRVATKFGRWEKNSAAFVKLQVWNSVKILF